MNRYLNLAHEVSLESNAKQQKMGSCIVKGGSILSVGCNMGWKHAEARAIRPHRDYRGATIYVMRANKRISRPCDDCQRLIIAAGISRAIYIGWDGTVVTETFKEAA